MTPSSGDTKFIVGEWAKVKVTPIEVEFYSNFRFAVIEVIVIYIIFILNNFQFGNKIVRSNKRGSVEKSVSHSRFL